MATWTETIQDWGSTVLQGVVDKEYRQEFELDRMKIQALGDMGYYDEGQAGAYMRAPGAGVSPGLLLLGGAVLLVFLLKD